MKMRHLVALVLVGLIMITGLNTAYASDGSNMVMVYKDGKITWVDENSQDAINQYGENPEQTVKKHEINAAPNKVTAKPTNQKITVDGKLTSFRAYNIDGYNYFMLRDIAYIFKGTKAQFEVGWDQSKFAINLEPSKNYTGEGVGFDMKTPHVSISGNKSKAAIYKNGQKALLLGFNIEGYTYFKLRDLGEELGFGVDWDNSSQTVVLLSDKDAPLPQPEPKPEKKSEQQSKWEAEQQAEPKDERPLTESQKQQMREDMLVLINKARKKEGLKALVLDDKLTEMAEYKSADMAKLNKMSHEGSYGNLQELINMFDIQYTTAGENVLFGGLSAEEMFDTWWNSPGHRANMMNPKFGKIGIGFADDKVIKASLGYDSKDLGDIAVYNEATGLYHVTKMSYWATQEFTN